MDQCSLPLFDRVEQERGNPAGGFELIVSGVGGEVGQAGGAAVSGDREEIAEAEAVGGVGILRQQRGEAGDA